ncbi:hypothetical protein H6P81_006966 [Aristolochia fimbriata]|uniref:Uncharacterized protein n=1 Tax=Aristolochia fimbriata TaxID=158543 RepID=A0AAV7F288_ARIFI|nr:hypothetical protein H6P81_006966 [Aristolochia fimbriata]
MSAEIRLSTKEGRRRVSSIAPSRARKRKKVQEVGILKKDPETLREQIEKLEMMNVYRLQILRMIHEVGINSRYFDGIEALIRRRNQGGTRLYLNVAT